MALRNHPYAAVWLGGLALVLLGGGRCIEGSKFVGRDTGSQTDGDISQQHDLPDLRDDNEADQPNPPDLPEQLKPPDMPEQLKPSDVDVPEVKDIETDGEIHRDSETEPRDSEIDHRDAEQDSTPSPGPLQLTLVPAMAAGQSRGGAFVLQPLGLSGLANVDPRVESSGDGFRLRPLLTPPTALPVP